ncbi:MAG: endonuclease/exonuclease/phosphatase family protein [Planctomycetaceae bacterium]
MKRTFNRVTITLLSLLTLTWGVGQVYRDVTWLTGLCFYVPSPVVAGGWMSVAVGSAWRRRRRFAGLTLVMALIPLAVICVRENSFVRSATPTSTSPTLRLVHWNVFRGHMGWDEIQQRLAGERADFYLLSEIPDGASLEELTRLRPDAGESQWFRIGIMAVWGRGTIEDLGWLLKTREAKVHLVRWHSPQGPVKILAVDLISDLQVHRDPVIQQIHRLIEEHQPDIIVGDFNAPRESLALSKLPSGFRHAYWTVGNGWSYTWPVPVPMFALDQCIFGSRITPRDYELKTSGLSDHRLGVFAFEVRGGGDTMGGEQASAEASK